MTLIFTETQAIIWYPVVLIISVNLAQNYHDSLFSTISSCFDNLVLKEYKSL